VGGTSTDWVGVDDLAAMRAVLDHVHAGGARSAAYLGARLTNSSSELRHTGFHRRAEELGLTVDPQWIQLGEYSVDWGERAVATLLEQGELPDALVCADDLIALGATRACRMHGIPVPERTQITGFDNIEFTRLAEPPLTTVAQPTDRIAAEAVRLLGDAANGTDTPRDTSRSCPSSWCAPARAATEHRGHGPSAGATRVPPEDHRRAAASRATQAGRIGARRSIPGVGSGDDGFRVGARRTPRDGRPD